MTYVPIPAFGELLAVEALPLWHSLTLIVVDYGRRKVSLSVRQSWKDIHTLVFSSSIKHSKDLQNITIAFISLELVSCSIETENQLSGCSRSLHLWQPRSAGADGSRMGCSGLRVSPGEVM